MFMKKQLANVFIFTLLGIISQASYAQRYNVLDDAIESQAQRWQSGEKARPIMSSDGKVIFPFGQAMPKLTCSPSRACDIELEPGEIPRTVILGDQANWTWQPADSIEKGKIVNHVVAQPRDNNVESNMIITTDRRTYHIKLYAPKKEGVYLNRVGFYYPEQLVTSWDERAGRVATAKAKEEAINAMPVPVSPEQMSFDYRVEGNADFKPARVFNDGERTYITMPEDVQRGEYPTLSLIDEDGKLMVVDYRRRINQKTGEVTFQVDKLFHVAELHRGKEKIKIIWIRKEKNLFNWGRG